MKITGQLTIAATFLVFCAFILMGGNAFSFNRTLTLKNLLKVRREEIINKTGKDPGRLNRWGNVR